MESLTRSGANAGKPVIFCGYTRADPHAVGLLARVLKSRHIVLMGSLDGVRWKRST